MLSMTFDLVYYEEEILQCIAISKSTQKMRISHLRHDKRHSLCTNETDAGNDH